MKKVIKVLIIVLILVLENILLLSVVFYNIDYKRVQNQELPLFCKKGNIANDGGTQEYIGLGYKVIDFNKISGYDKIKIGSYFMKYEDFEDEIAKEEKEMQSKVIIENNNGNYFEITEKAQNLKDIILSNNFEIMEINDKSFNIFDIKFVNNGEIYYNLRT